MPLPPARVSRSDAAAEQAFGRRENGSSVRRRFVTTTVKGDRRQAPDLLDRNVTAGGPDRLWVADISVPQQAA